MRRARSLRLLVGVAVASLVLAACGSSSTDSDNDASSAPSEQASSQQEETTESEEMTDSEETSSEEETTEEETTEDSDSEEGDSDEGDSEEGDSEESGPSMTGDMSKVKLGLAYDLGGRGDQSFNDSAARGLDKADDEGVEVAGELTAEDGESDSAKVDRLNQLVKDGANAIVAVGFAYAGPLGEVAPDNPDVNFAIVDDNTLCTGDDPMPNVDCMTFAEHEGSFLVGAAAALKTESDQVGFIGGVDNPLIQKFQAGFDAGVEAVNPDIEISDKYISEPPDFSGFNDPSSGQTIAKGMYDSGIDIVYASAGASGAGVFKAAKSAGDGHWGIGVDSDQYNVPALDNVKDVILTSMIKNVDVGVYDFFVSVVNGEPLTGDQTYDLKAGGVSYSTSGGFVDDIASELDEYKQKIIDGDIEVPSTVG